MKPLLLIVDDDEEIRTQLRWALAKEYEIVLGQDRAGAVEVFRARRPMVVLLDLGLPPKPGTPEEGLAALAELLAIDEAAKIIIVSGQGEKTNALSAVGTGAYDFLCKPVDIQELKLLLRRCFYVAQLEREYRDMQRHLQSDGFEGMLGHSPAMQSVFEAIRKVATTDAPVLLLGESGTGKEMAALAVHQRSSRKKQPFIAINCSAIPETLLESELFGHEKGAFTGAHVQRKGRIEQADGGTLFLDEIGEIPLPIQVKLLRFLQEQRIERVGGRQEIQVDVRVIAATNADLAKGMQTGTFREDLFYRLAVVKVQLPALRERADDVRLLAQAFLQRFAQQNRKSSLTFGSDAIQAIHLHPWPGNVRELQNRVRRAVIMGEGKRLTAADLELTDANSGTALTTLREARETVERKMIRNALQRNSGNVSAAASDLGVSRPTLYELLEKLGIQRTEPEKAPDAHNS
jgi:two-component system NtrC family response regulator